VGPIALVPASLDNIFATLTGDATEAGDGGTPIELGGGAREGSGGAGPAVTGAVGPVRIVLPARDDNNLPIFIILLLWEIIGTHASNNFSEYTIQ
jgi:hypothetical protein